MPEYGLHLCDDLIFTSRVGGEAKAQGLTLHAKKKGEDLLQLARQAPPRCVIIDLHLPGLDVAALVGELAALTPKPIIVGYGSHVDVATLKKAREAGCDLVWPRSKFVEELATALPLWYRPAETGS
ncbi:MAG: response regulator [Planctomycetes bacterium]|nr:response regulator [Planctomycetota bacterium]